MDNTKLYVHLKILLLKTWRILDLLTESLSSVLFGPADSLFRGTPLTITRDYFRIFLYAFDILVSHYNETLFYDFFIYQSLTTFPWGGGHSLMYKLTSLNI